MDGKQQGRSILVIDRHGRVFDGNGKKLGKIPKAPKREKRVEKRRQERELLRQSLA